MRQGPIIGAPTALFVVAGFILALVALFVLVQVGLVTVAFNKLGLTTGQGFLVLLATLVGGGVNLPVLTTRRLVRDVLPGPMRMFVSFGRGIDLGGARLGDDLVPQRIAVNLGGCVLPVMLSIYVLTGLNPEHVAGAGGAGAVAAFLVADLAVVAAVAWRVGRPAIGTGPRVSIFPPVAMNVLVCLFVVPPELAPQVAYVGGSLGILLGAGLLPLVTRRRAALDAPLISIGGPGTFGAVFFCGVVAALLT